MKVLIIEDADFMALAMQSALEQQGHQVDWICGVHTFEPFVGIDKNEQPMSNSLDVSSYDVVFCDGQLFGQHQGPAVVEVLAARNIACVGISSEHKLNNEMCANGATFGALKTYIFAAMVENELPVESCRQPSAELIAAVNGFEQRFRDDESLRRKLDDKLRAHMG
jgi:hypothetical protein